ncbi:MAG TPA: TolC family outer membrane protein, partial [Gemmataceae bacterium]|nr:TolC family outer membrane protein [Gemmataceae bacterium]
RLILIGIIAAGYLTNGDSAKAEAFTIVDAISQAVQTNPGVGEATANRRATDAELHQSQGTLLPQVRLEASGGPERFNQTAVVPAPTGNGLWLPARTGSVVIRQTLFDGFASINEIWRQSARVDAAAHRVHERSELIALDAAEAYISMIRFSRLITVSQDNVAAHRRILDNVQARFNGGRAGEGDLQQALERVAAAEAALAEFRQSLEDARAAYRKSVGLEPINLRAPGRLRGLPASKDESLAVALRYNPTIRAAQSDADAAKYGFDATAGSFAPNVSLEGRTLRGIDSDTIFGPRSESSGKVVLGWDIFTGGQDSWKRAAAAERYNEQKMRHARLQRDAFESLDKAWAARTITSDRAAALLRQVNADRKAIAAYNKEYELGQRSLIDLLNAENQLYNGLVSLESTRDVAIFADYQLLAAMGQLLAYLKAPESVDALPLETIPLGVFPIKIAPILFRLPQTGSEPLNVRGALPDGTGSLPAQPKVATFGDRWPQLASLPDPAAALAQFQPSEHQASGVASPGEANGTPAFMSFAPEMLQVSSRSAGMNKPN